MGEAVRVKARELKAKAKASMIEKARFLSLEAEADVPPLHQSMSPDGASTGTGTGTGTSTGPCPDIEELGLVQAIELGGVSSQQACEAACAAEREVFQQLRQEVLQLQKEVEFSAKAGNSAELRRQMNDVGVVKAKACPFMRCNVRCVRSHQPECISPEEYDAFCRKRIQPASEDFVEATLGITAIRAFVGVDNVLAPKNMLSREVILEELDALPPCSVCEAGERRHPRGWGLVFAACGLGLILLSAIVFAFVDHCKSAAATALAGKPS